MSQDERREARVRKVGGRYRYSSHGHRWRAHNRRGRTCIGRCGSCHIHDVSFMMVMPMHEDWVGRRQQCDHCSPDTGPVNHEPGRVTAVFLCFFLMYFMSEEGGVVIR